MPVSAHTWRVTVPAGTGKSSTGRPRVAAVMKSVHAGSAARAPVIPGPIVFFSSNPTQQRKSMTTVVEAEAAFKAAQDKKNAADSSLIDALSKEKELRGQLGRLLADSAPTTDVLAVRQDRDQTRQDVEDLEAAIEHLTADVATARQAVYQAKVAEARATMQEQGDALSTAVEALEAAIQNVVKFKRTDRFWPSVLLMPMRRA